MENKISLETLSAAN